jgi:formylglycine-generating enzyme required for sulfatase activity
MRALAGLLLVLPIASCAADTPPRPQWLIVVDTDLPVVGQLSGDETLSPASAVDTVRIDILGSDLRIEQAQQVVAPDVRDWPVSFGVLAPRDASRARVLVRIRVFRASIAAAEDGEPLPRLTTERLLALDVSSASGAPRIRVDLSGDCLGRPSTYRPPYTTCIDAQRVDASAAGISPDASTPTRAGTWAGAREVPCRAEAPSHAVCVPGGFSILGDRRLNGLGPRETSPAPEHPVFVAPFLMDRTEVTVGRARALLRRRALKNRPPTPFEKDTDRRFCTWISTTDGRNDLLPLNCIGVETAREICELEGGRLPTEAQWEHAARGRGQQHSYPWGDSPPQCCGVSASRESWIGVTVECPGAGPERAGSHKGSPACPGDVSRDGVLDLAGSLREMTRDALAAYDSACWSAAGILVDPECSSNDLSFVVRGGDWSAGLFNAHAALRDVGHAAVVRPTNAVLGFRCVYPDEEQ